MDLKVRRAALSAAIKVTVSASLLSCGGIASSSNPRHGMAGGTSADQGGTSGTTNVEAAGTANVEAAGAPAAGTAPASECGSPQTNDCLAYFDGLQLKPGQDLPEGMAVACCQVVLDEMAATATDAEGRQCSLALYQSA